MKSSSKQDLSAAKCAPLWQRIMPVLFIIILLITALWQYALPALAKQLILNQMKEAKLSCSALNIEHIGINHARIKTLNFQGEGFEVAIKNLRIAYPLLALLSGKNAVKPVRIETQTLELSLSIEALLAAKAVGKETNKGEGLSLSHIETSLKTLPAFSLKIPDASVRLRYAKSNLDRILACSMEASHTLDETSLQLHLQHEASKALLLANKKNTQWTWTGTLNMDKLSPLLKHVPPLNEEANGLSANGLHMELSGTSNASKEGFTHKAEASINLASLKTTRMPLDLENISISTIVDGTLTTLMHADIKHPMLSEHLKVKANSHFDPLTGEWNVHLQPVQSEISLSNITFDTHTIESCHAEMKTDFYLSGNKAKLHTLDIQADIRQLNTTLTNPALKLEGLSTYLEARYDFRNNTLSYPSTTYTAETLNYEAWTLSELSLALPETTGLLPETLTLKSRFGNGHLRLDVTRPEHNSTQWNMLLNFEAIDAALLKPVWNTVSTRLRGKIDGELALTWAEDMLALNFANLAMNRGGYVNLQSETMSGVMAQISKQVTTSIRQALQSQGMIPKHWESDLDGKIRKVLNEVYVSTMYFEWNPQNTGQPGKIHLEGNTMGEPAIPLVLDMNVAGDISEEFQALIGLFQIFGGDMSGIDKLRRQ